MAKAKMRTAKKDTDFGNELLASAREALAHKRGEIALPTRVVEPLSAARVKQIRKSVAKSTREFEKRFCIPARTVEGWEQGRPVDLTSRLLLLVIEKNHMAVERALSAA
jgi:putative transcriptional regulator